MQLSIIIPVKNGEATLGKCLDAIRRQTISNNIEIIILDSMSSDKSREIAEKFETKIIDVPSGTFNHGATRNLGVQYAKSELLYFTVQDAFLAENDQLEKMSAHFTDAEIQSVTGIQGVPNDLDKNPAVWFRRFSKPVPEIRQFDTGVFQKFSAKEQLKYCDWDDVNAMYRKTALQVLPFQKTDFAEDALWARDALMRGWKIIRDSSFLVYHYHHQGFNYAFRNRYTINYTFFKHFKVLPEIHWSVMPLGKSIYRLFRRKELSLYRKLQWSWHNFVRLFSEFLSPATFRLVFFLGGEKMLDKSFKLFCSAIPQGIQNKSRPRDK